MDADDSQLYVDFSPCDEKTALANLQRCIQEVREWSRENFLLLNDKKTEVVIFGKDTIEKQLQIGKSVISSMLLKVWDVFWIQNWICRNTCHVFANQLTTTYIALGRSATL